MFLVAGDLFIYQAVRQATSFLAVPMSVELNYSKREVGWLLAAPSIGAIVTQVAGGRICSFFDVRWTVLLSLVGMAVCCSLLPVACSHSISAAAAVLCINGLC